MCGTRGTGQHCANGKNFVIFDSSMWRRWLNKYDNGKGEEVVNILIKYAELMNMPA